MVMDETAQSTYVTGQEQVPLGWAEGEIRVFGLVTMTSAGPGEVWSAGRAPALVIRIGGR